MFKKGQILINKKNPSFVITIISETGEARVLKSKNYQIGDIIQCGNIKFYNICENPEEYLKDLVVSKYTKNKTTKITTYL